jgi:hypothetical protein
MFQTLKKRGCTTTSSTYQAFDGFRSQPELTSVVFLDLNRYRLDYDIERERRCDQSPANLHSDPARRSPAAQTCHDQGQGPGRLLAVSAVRSPHHQVHGSAPGDDPQGLRVGSITTAADPPAPPTRRAAPLCPHRALTTASPASSPPTSALFLNSATRVTPWPAWMTRRGLGEGSERTRSACAETTEGPRQAAGSLIACLLRDRMDPLENRFRFRNGWGRQGVNLDQGPMRALAEQYESDQ